MSSGLSRLIEAFAGLRVLVVGEAMLDSYLHGSASHLCREAPVPVVAVSGRTDAPGGAANTAANAASLGADVTLLSATGDDEEGAGVRAALAAHGVRTDHVLAAPGRRTLTKRRVVADGQMLLRFDQGSTEPLDPETEAELLRRLAALYPACDAVIVSDYAYGVLTPAAVRAVAALQARWPRVLVTDARELRRYRAAHPTAVKPNYSEAVHLLGEPELAGAAARVSQIADHAGRLLDLTGAQMAAVTLDTDGALVFERGGPPYRTYARPERHARAAGAGDTFAGTLALALAAGADVPAAAEIASAAAAVVVGKDGTAACTRQELRAYLVAEDKYLADRSLLADRAELYRRRGLRVVFTNGCFDILHRGHITYLNRAKALGDVLIVGLNSDESVRRLKGPGRPINPLEDRAQVLAALSCVDLIVPFQEDTPEELLRIIRPDLLVKGGDYTRETLPEAPLVERLGGAVQILPYVEDRSTTGIIERIRRAGAAAGNGGRREDA
ncbi:MAG TPA: D-glycero-beta-D-manno-heptose 1-phosphate adenylyltransferase [Dehalococcoidia bacterium]